ncbi:MAG: flagellar hook protein FlgE [Deltaproteobacteria bacterium]|nr:flagellar hook protein FlgE [Deltaproteobacteria bacterium]
MALSSALFSGISGLSNLGNAMQIIGDNIANVNTVGFKSSSFTFQDLLSQSMFTRAGTSQVGRGTALSDIYATFEQGSFESTGNTTDLAIGGDGFFAVREPTTASLFYTRAGNFRFDREGYMINPEGYVVQGWAVDPEGNITGSTTDIAMTSFTSQPQATESMTIITNLDMEAIDHTTILSSAWDGTSDTPIAGTSYEYQSTVKAYDSLGSTHDVTVYYDKISNGTWEYIVTCNPEEDMRAGMAGTTSAGLLARGRINFNEGSGDITGITMSNLSGATATNQSVSCDAANFTGTLLTNNATATVLVHNAEELTSAAAATWMGMAGAGELEWNGTNWVDGAGAAIPGVTGTASQINIDFGGAAGNDITINLSQNAAATDTVQVDLSGSDDWTVATSADINTDGYFEFGTDFIGGAATAENIALDIGVRWNGSSFVPDSLATTQYASSSTTVYQSADGYGAGDLEGVDVDVDGLITGVYSNGQVLPLYRLALAKFQSLQGLYKEGGNLYRETRESGPATTSLPGSNGLGNIAPNSLEQSNVDIANEFVKMITTQRGFQANSKIITVTDQMLAELINLKH